MCSYAHCVQVMHFWLKWNQTMGEFQTLGVSEAAVSKFLNCMCTPQLYFCVALGDVAKAKCTHWLENGGAEWSTNKRAYQTGEVWKKVIRREPQRWFLCVVRVQVRWSGLSAGSEKDKGKQCGCPGGFRCLYWGAAVSAGELVFTSVLACRYSGHLVCSWSVGVWDCQSLALVLKLHQQSWWLLSLSKVLILCWFIEPWRK